MSDALAIATVTAMLRSLLTQGLGGDTAIIDPQVTTRPPDRARNNDDSSNQINLFLYHTAPNSTWRNMDIPWRVKAGETANPPLAINLYYLLTAYYGSGENQENIDSTTVGTRLLGSHRLLGRAMSILYDNAVLDAGAINAILPSGDRLEHQYDQVENVRITTQPLSVNEMSELWNGFQTQYRLSVAYEVSVVLIDSTQPTRTPLAVLTRGPDDSGVIAERDLTPPFPTLESVIPPNQQPSVHLDDVVTIQGHHLEGDDVVVRFENPRLPDVIELAVPSSDRNTTEITIQIPNDSANWVGGFYTLSAVISRTGFPDRTTNELPFALSPRITTALPITVPRDAGDAATINLTCSPEVRPAQRVALLLGDREILAQPHPIQTAALQFSVPDAPEGTHFVRLRIDGVDSLLVDRTAKPPVFDATQQVTIT